MKVEIYSDVACPWCYIGKRRFQKALDGFTDGEVEVVFRPYQLDPNAPADALPVTEYLEGRYGAGARQMLAQVSSAAAAEGITIDWERALAVNTRTAHRLLRLAAREYGPEVQRALVERLFSLHFTRGGDVSDAGTLADEAATAGMDRERAASYLASDEATVELEAEFAQARERGIRAVPTFIFEGKYSVEGAQPLETFTQVLERVAQLEAAGGTAGEP